MSEEIGISKRPGMGHVLLAMLLKGVGTVGRCFAAGLMLSGAYLYYDVIVREMAWPSVLTALRVVVGSWCLFNVVFNYLMAGLRSVSLSKEEQAVADQMRAHWCAYCSKFQLDKDTTEHCFACGCCVPGTDHHCVWIGSHVGVKNQRWFVLFLVYTIVACPMFAMEAGIALHGMSTERAGGMSLTLAAVVLGVLTLPALLFAFLQLCMIAQGSSTLGTYLNERKKGGSATSKLPQWRRNFSEFFGTTSMWRWFMPTLQAQPALKTAVSSDRRRGGVLQSV